MNNTQETFQKIPKKSKSYDNTEGEGAANSSKKDSYKHIRSMKREWREE